MPAFTFATRRCLKPGDAAALGTLAGHVFEQPLDRRRPLWELWLIEGALDGWALLTKTHHCLIDPVGGVDLSSVLFDLDPLPLRPLEAEPEAILRPEPTPATKLVDALTERVREPLALLRGAAAAASDPKRTLRTTATTLRGLASIVGASTIDRAPATPFDVRVGPHRRFTWATASLQEFRVLRAALGGTVEDVVLTVVAGRAARLPAAARHPRREADAEGDGAAAGDDGRRRADQLDLRAAAGRRARRAAPL